MEVMEKKIKKRNKQFILYNYIILIIFIEFKIIKFIILELINNVFMHITSNFYLILLLIIFNYKIKIN